MKDKVLKKLEELKIEHEISQTVIDKMLILLNL